MTLAHAPLATESTPRNCVPVGTSPMDALRHARVIDDFVRAANCVIAGSDVGNRSADIAPRGSRLRPTPRKQTAIAAIAIGSPTRSPKTSSAGYLLACRVRAQASWPGRRTLPPRGSVFPGGWWRPAYAPRCRVCAGRDGAHVVRGDNDASTGRLRAGRR
jgi:hypothetical protein